LAKIKRLVPKGKADHIEHLKMLLERAENGEFDNFIFAAKLKTDGEIATSWVNADMGLRQELIAHQQIDVMCGVIETNYFEE
jgi:hypothetical protein